MSPYSRDTWNTDAPGKGWQRRTLWHEAVDMALDFLGIGVFLVLYALVVTLVTLGVTR